MTFMGIPIDGHINSFTQKIKSKGFTIAPANKHYSNGRLFIGEFCGEKVLAFACYSKSKSVYCIEVHFHVRSEVENLQLYNDYIEAVRKKYPDGKEDWPYTETSYSWSVNNGSIYIENREDYNGNKLRITYIDKANSEEMEHLNQKLIMDDL